MRILQIIFGLVGALMVLAAEVSPEQLTSNYAAWAKELGINDIPEFITTSHADTWGFYIGLILVVIAVLSFFLNRREKQQVVNEKKLFTPDKDAPVLSLQHVNINRNNELPEYINGFGLTGSVISPGNYMTEFLTEHLHGVTVLKLINHSDKTIFSIEFPISGFFFDPDDAIKHNNQVVDESIALKKIKPNLSFTNEHLEPNGEMLFCICNLSEHCVYLNIKGIIFGKFAAIERKRVIPYINEFELGVLTLGAINKNYSLWYHLRMQNGDR